MATTQRIVKGILKKKGNTEVFATRQASEVADPSTSSDTEVGGCKKPSKKFQKWDELRMLTTYPPPEYGLLHSTQPATPKFGLNGGDSEEENSSSDSDVPPARVSESLARRLALAQGKEPKLLVRWGESHEDEEDLKRQFELKRKLHYSEGLNIKFARQLISQEQFSDTDGETAEDQAPHGSHKLIRLSTREEPSVDIED